MMIVRYCYCMCACVVAREILRGKQQTLRLHTRMLVEVVREIQVCNTVVENNRKNW